MGPILLLHGVALAVVVVSELIGTRSFKLGPGLVLFLPLLYAYVMGLAVNPEITPVARRLLSSRSTRVAAGYIVVAAFPIVAKLGTVIGPALKDIIAAGPALLFQELGNLGTIVLAFPVAVFLLKMGREAIGATFSVARESSLLIIAEKYGLDSREGHGVMGVYISGTLFGTIVFAFLGGWMGSLGWLSVEALAMACGVGSSSMMAACAGSIAEVAPASKDEILALAGASNLLTVGTGLYAALLLALPAVERWYGAVEKRRTRGDRAQREGASS
jgi:hypothetical protein